MAEYNFGSIMNRDFILELKRMAKDVNVQGKTIQDLVAEGQLTEEQYEELITVINGLIKSGHVDKSDLTPEFKDEIEGFSTQLAQTATKEEVEEKADNAFVMSGLNNKRDRDIKLEPEDLSDNTLDLITGGSVDLLTIPQDQSVTPNKLTNLLQKYIAMGFEWEMGTITTSGELITTSTRIRTNSMVLLEKGTVLKVDDPNYQYGYSRYNLSDQSHEFNSGYIGDETVLNEDGYYRLFMRKTDDSELTGIIEAVATNLLVYGNEALFNVDSSRLKDKSVNPSKLDTDMQSNLFRVLSSFELGSVNGNTGDNINANNRIRSPYTQLEKNTALTINDNAYQFSYIIFDDNNNVVTNSSWLNEIEFSEDTKCRIIMRRVDNADISDIDKVSKSLLVLSEKSVFKTAKNAYRIAANNEKRKLNLTTFGVTGSLLTKDRNELIIQGNSQANYNVPLEAERFLEVEFEAKASVENQAEFHFKFGAGYNWHTPFVTIDNTEFKPYKLICYNHHDNPTAYIQFLTKENCDLEVKNVSIKVLDRVPRGRYEDVRFIAHRGLSTFAPENTAPAYTLASKFGVWGVEADARQTSDGVWVLLHDETIDRTSDGTGNVASMTYEQLLQYDFGSWRDERYTGTKIMTLDEFVFLCKQTGMQPYIEMKTPLTESNVAGFVDIIVQYGMLDKTTILSALINDLQLASTESNGRLRLAYSSVVTQERIDGLKALGDKVVFSSGQTYVSDNNDIPATIRLAHENGVDVEIWTINDFDTIRTLSRAGVSGISTDRHNLAGCYY